MGSVHRLESGRWQARWRAVSNEQKKRSFRTKAEAQRWLAEVEITLARGVYMDHRVSGTPLGDYVAGWIVTKPWRESTRRRIENMARVHILSQPIAKMPINRITATDVQTWVTGRSAVLAPSTVRLVVKVMRAVLLAAVDDHLIPASPARRVVLPSPVKARVRPLTVPQVLVLADAMPDRCRAMVITQAGLGLRVGELFALRVQDVDFLRRTVHVGAQIRQHDRARVPTKTARSVRTVPLPAVVADAIAAHLAAWPARDGLVFTTLEGRPWHQSYYASRMMTAAVALAGLPKGTTTHDLRHHYVSVMLDAGASVPEVAELIGDTVATVMETYAHMMPGREDRARLIIDRAWCAPGAPSSDKPASDLG